MNKKLALATVTITVIAGLIVASPGLVGAAMKREAAKRGWAVEYESLEWSWTEVRLRGVKASNAWLSAKLDKVILTIDGRKLEHVAATGGTIEADYLKRPRGEGGESVRSRFESMSVTVHGVCGGSVTASGVKKEESGTLTAMEASAKCSGWSGMASRLTRERKPDGDSIRVERATVQREPSEKGERPPSTDSKRMEAFPWLLEVEEITLEAAGRVKASRVKVHRTKYGAYLTATNASAQIDGWEVVTNSPSVQFILLKEAFPTGEKGDNVKVNGSAQTIETIINGVSKRRIEVAGLAFGAEVDVRAWKEGTVKMDDIFLSFQNVIWLGGSGSWRGWRDFSLDFEMKGVLSKDAECQRVIDAAPPGLMESLDGFKFSGTLHPKVHIATKEGKHEVMVSLGNKCKITSAPASASVANFSKGFTRKVHGPSGEKEVVSGPGTKEWTPIGRISVYMAKAVTATEDLGFYSHNGFLEQALEASIRENLSAGKFVRGGSTITMQLAKNLWLSRTKTLSRKAQEFFLTTYLEQSLSKQDIMELYLNVVELGPDVHGIRAGTEYYFKKGPEELTLAEAVFLASILPSPRKERFSPDGTMFEGQAQYVRTVIRTMASKGLITESEAEEGLKQEVVKVKSRKRTLAPIVVEPGGVDPRSWQ